jgi:hypothetical protein
MISETNEYCVMNRNVVATHKAIKTDIAKKESKTLQERKKTNYTAIPLPVLTDCNLMRWFFRTLY